MSDRQALLDQIAAQEELVRRMKYRREDRFNPNHKQREFCNTQARETAFMAVNQAGGKSYALKGITAFHLTGRYPSWWKGHRFAHPVVWAIGGETVASTRDLLVNGIYLPTGDEIIGLLGPETDRGTGWVPRECLGNLEKEIEARITYGNGIPGQIDQFTVKHFTDGVHDGESICFVFSYSAGWERMRGYTLHGVSMDEEPKASERGFELYDQMSTRLNKTGGVLYLAMSPEQSYTQIVQAFDQDKTGVRAIIFGSVDDAQHVPEDQRDFLKKKYAGHYMEDVRLRGHWVMGEGMIYNVPDSEVVCDPFQIPLHWPKIIGVDFPHTTGSFAAVWMARDPETDCAYIYREYKAKNQPRAIYVDALLAGGAEDIPVAWPHDGNRVDSAGKAVADYYRERGVYMLQDPAGYYLSDGKWSNSVHRVIDDCRDRMRLGTLKIFSNCQGILAEKRSYHSKNGAPADDQDDHEIDAMHKAVMCLERAIAPVGRYSSPSLSHDFFGV